MTDLRIADAPELTAAEVNDSLKVPTGGYGNYSITMITIRDWLLNYKMFATQSYVDAEVNTITTALNTHTARVDNPHQVTKSQVGLGNVDNTSDINKPVSAATQTALTNLNTSLTAAISVKANTADVYTKSVVYTKSESDAKYHQKLSIDGVLAPTSVFDDVKNLDGVNGTPDSIINQPIQNLANRTEFLKTHNNLSGRDSANAHPASSILDVGGQTQQQINDNTPRLTQLITNIGSNLIGYEQQYLYTQNTIGAFLNAFSNDDVYLLNYIPPSEHANIINGTSTYNASTAIVNAVSDAISRNARLVLPSGQITYSSFPNIKTQGFKLVGQGSTKTKLNYTGTGIALNFDAFIDNQPTDPFVHGLFIAGFHIVGSTFTTGLNSQGVARSFFSDIMVNGSSGVDGTVAFKFSGTMLSVFNNLKTSYVYGDLPYRGFFLQAGTRAAVNVGGCSNNTWISTYAEGNSIGIQFASNGGDQNTFIGGSPEACKVYGLLVGQNCRYNTFIGVGAENSDASVTADISDSGIHSEYKNCYSSKKVLIGGTSRGVKISGGYFERIEFQANSSSGKVDNVTVNNWATGAGGFVDAGFDTSATRVYDADLAAFIYPRKARFAVTVGASPFLYENTHQIPIKVRVIGGTVTQVLFRRGGDSWIEANPTASGGGTGTVGTYLLAAGDKVEISYSAAPTMNVITMPI